MQFSDVLAKVAQNLRLNPEELDFLRRMGDETQLRNQQVGGLINSAGQITAVNYNPLSGLMRVLGDIYVAGGDVRIDAITGQTEDPHLTFYIDGVRVGEVWYDRDGNALNISQNKESANVGVTLRSNVSTNQFFIYDTDNAYSVHRLRVDGSHVMKAMTSDPAYIDGNVIIYFYSSGGTDELRVRGKIGAVETQVTLANLSP